MKCPGCEYELWNLKAGPCPECGRPFKPSDFDFLPNAVKFCCPHCSQAYYGTSEKGQLVPSAFGCVSCGRHVTTDEMLLLPADALGKREPTKSTNPWLDGTRKGSGKWLSAIGASLGQPGRMLEATPAIGSSGKAMSFAVSNFIIAGLLGLTCATVVLFTGGGADVLVFMALASLIGPAVYMFAWTAITHVLLRFLGQSSEDGISRTFQAIAFSSGGWVLSLIPCFGALVGFVAWSICAPIAVRAAHKAAGWPATLATLAFPFLVALGVAGFYVWMTFSAMNFSASSTSQSWPQSVPMGPQTNWAPGTDIRLGTQRVANVVRRNAQNNTLPTHVAYLASEPGFDPLAFFERGGGRAPRVGPSDIFALSTMDIASREAVLDPLVTAWPTDITAHRVGRQLMTYHGFDANQHPDLWLMVQLPAEPQEDFWAITLNGYVQIDRSMPQTFVNLQNRLRMAAGLDPLPEMATMLGAPGPWTAADGKAPEGAPTPPPGGP